MGSCSVSEGDSRKRIFVNAMPFYRDFTEEQLTIIYKSRKFAENCEEENPTKFHHLGFSDDEVSLQASIKLPNLFKESMNNEEMASNSSNSDLSMDSSFSEVESSRPLSEMSTIICSSYSDYDSDNFRMENAVTSPIKKFNARSEEEFYPVQIDYSSENQKRRIVPDPDPCILDPYFKDFDDSVDERDLEKEFEPQPTSYHQMLTQKFSNLVRHYSQQVLNKSFHGSRSDLLDF